MRDDCRETSQLPGSERDARSWRFVAFR